MAAWPASTGEALHTSTFLGHPIGCAAALATMDEFERLHLVARGQRMGALLATRAQSLRHYACVRAVRGRGMLYGIVLDTAISALAVVARALSGGAIVLQSGIEGNVVTIAPPLTIESEQLDAALDIVEGAVAATA
jgi:4-aminobutyrate aminotransferase-like enzyme